jgi:hypothetical protein
MEFKTYESFFERTGDSYIEPIRWGECLWPVSVEEMYQHFKARLISEIAAESPELLERAKLVDVAPNAALTGERTEEK